MEEYDLLSISEAWFMDNSCPSFEKYTFHRRDIIVRNGGGVCINQKKY